MLNWFSSACIVRAVHAGFLYVNTMISMVLLFWTHSPIQLSHPRAKQDVFNPEGNVR